MLRFAPSIPVTEKEAWVHPEIVKISSQEPEASLVSYVAEKIRAGEVLGMPTDTFYGLAADPFNLHAVDRVYEIKSRSRHKPLSLLIESVDQAAELAWPVPAILPCVCPPQKFRWPSSALEACRSRPPRPTSAAKASAPQPCRCATNWEIACPSSWMAASPRATCLLPSST